MRYAVIAVVLLAGCVTVQDVQTSGDLSEHALRQSPRDAAGCLARNAENYWPGIQTYVRSAGNGNEEVVVRNGPDFALVHALVSPAAEGSRATIRRRTPIFRPELVPAMLAGC